MTEVEIRDARLQDAAAIAVLEQTCFAHEGERLSGRTIRHLIRSERSIVLVALEGESVLGYAEVFWW